jgi:hypothetical protein
MRYKALTRADNELHLICGEGADTVPQVGADSRALVPLLKRPVLSAISAASVTPRLEGCLLEHDGTAENTSFVMNASSSACQS